MTSTDLLNFAEAAQLLGFVVEKVRRLVVEDRSLRAVRVSANGDRNSVDLDSLHEGGWRIDDQGRLCLATPIFEQRRLVRLASYEPLDVGVLRIEREELDRHCRSIASTAAFANIDSAELDPAEAATRHDAVDLGLPLGLEPATIASVFDGVAGTKAQWIERLKKPNKWLKSPPVVTRKGLRGKGPGGTHVPTLRNPVEFAKHLIKEKGCKPYSLHTRFMKEPDLAEWRRPWEDYRAEVKELSGDWHR